ncbi:MAG TPA: PAS domain-containing protein [Usitatibacter sp.]|nr:PAS domain-containing protein [Usitatibacter sp.]
MSSPEMIARVQSYDWAGTPLGPMAQWPQSLRIAVGICLSSRFPMFVWWGPTLVNIYNDAYVPILGAKHPEALGRPAQPTWSEIWDVVGPQAEAVMREGAATWNERVLLVMQRHGYVEDTWFTWSYSPIWDESGTVGGVFCACTEETGRVVAERDRDRLLQEVEHERARLSEAFEQSPAFLAILRGPEHVCDYVNERYSRLIGGRNIVGKALREALPEVAGQGFFELLDAVYRTGEPYVGTSMRIMLQRKPDRPMETAFVDFVYQPLREADGQVTGILVHGVDVTERAEAETRDRFLVQLEDALRALEDPREITLASARLFAEHLQADRVAYADVEADEDTFNLAGDYARGVPSIVGRYRFADFGEEVLRDMREGKAFVVRDVDTHQPPIGDLTYYRRAKIQALICVPLLKAGRFVAAMAAHQSVPRRWTRAEVELAEHVASRCYESIERSRVERTLRESEMRFRALADSMPQIVFAADADGNVDYFNRQWYEYTGLPEGETGFESWRHVHTEEGLARVAQAWPEALRTGQPYEIEYPLRRHDGVFRWHLGRALPIRDAGGKVIRWFGTNTDIHDRKQIEDALAQALRAEQEARGEAELASRMKDEFLATLSHELRTPLNAILGWSHMLRRPTSGAEEVARGAEVIERNARSQAKIIEDLLDMSAIISGKVRLDVTAVDLASIVLAAVETARPAAEAKQITMDVQVLPLEGLQMRGDATRLQQVMWNLLSNALKFTPRGGRIEVKLRSRGGQAEVCVSDSGQGIAPEFLPFVFDRFRQADATITRKAGGLGLGLAIVKQLVELHGGTVTAESGGEGQGATFTFTLPPVAFSSGSPRAGGRDGEERPEAGQATARERERVAGKRVLVVDDEADARDLVRKILEDCGAVVVTAGSSDEAIGIAQHARFDVLVSDIGMPGEDGYELMRRLRRQTPERNGDIPAIALTAYARPEDRTRSLRAGFQRHIAKPVEPAELISVVGGLAG